MSKYKTVLVTGATSGVGFELAIQLHAQGHRVIATGRNEVKLQQLKKQRLETIAADLTNRASLQQLVDQLPNIDVAIINAGIGTFEYAAALEDAAIH
ncbi:SDR family NAD(P)-dependent oxidoreductase, partial [Kurthia sp. Dielmo]